jgi:hypothetical protein
MSFNHLYQNGLISLDGKPTAKLRETAFRKRINKFVGGMVPGELQPSQPSAVDNSNPSYAGVNKMNPTLVS